MREKKVGAEYWVTMVCVDSYENSVLSGRFFNPFLEAPQEFASLAEFLIMMECTLDTMQLPQAYSASRTFGPTPIYEPGKPIQMINRGDQATFSLSIRFRQHNSWQGTVSWLESGKTQSFRSVLELIVLMDSALRESNGTPGQKDRVVLA